MIQKVRRLIVGLSAADDKMAFLRSRKEAIETAVSWRRFGRRLKREDKINRAFDHRHGTDTATECLLTEAGVSAEEAKRGNGVYRPVFESEFRRSLKDTGIRFEGFTFVDIGSGKGKMLMLASEYPFARIVGVEYAQGLHEVALANLAHFSSPTQRCHRIEAVHADALSYQIPSGPVLGMIFNAVDSSTMRELLRHLEAQLGDRGEPAFLIYSNLRRVSEIGTAFDVLRSLRMLRQRHKMVLLGNEAGAALLRGRSLMLSATART